MVRRPPFGLDLSSGGITVAKNNWMTRARNMTAQRTRQDCRDDDSYQVA